MSLSSSILYKLFDILHILNLIYTQPNSSAEEQKKRKLVDRLQKSWKEMYQQGKL